MDKSQVPVQKIIQEDRIPEIKEATSHWWQFWKVWHIPAEKTEWEIKKNPVTASAVRD